MAATAGLANGSAVADLIPGDSVAPAVAATPLELPLAQPLSHELFLDSAFEADAFLLSRRHTSLDDLRIDLRAYLATLRAELVALINEDYEDFIGLGVGLRGTVERGLAKMRLPVEEVRVDLLRARAGLEEVKREVEGQLEERKRLREGKDMVKLWLSCAESVSKVEDLLGIAPPPSPKPAATVGGSTKRRHRRSSVYVRPVVLDDLGLDSGTKRIERIVGEFNQMLYLVSRGTGSAFVNRLKPRIDGVRAALHRDLASLFKDTLRMTPSPAKQESLAECLRSYEMLGLVSEAEDTIKREVVLPNLAEIIRPLALSAGPLSPVTPSPSAGPLVDPGDEGYRPLPVPESSEAAALPLLYNKILAFIARDLMQIVVVGDRQVSQHLHSTHPPTFDRSKSDYNILLHSVFRPLLQSLASTLGQTLFASGNPSVFHRHFRCTQQLLSRFEALCSSPAQIKSLREDSERLSFEAKWQLAVYAQLRTREVVTRLEEALSEKRGEEAPPNKREPGGHGFAMRATDATYHAIWTVWQADVFIDLLAHRFWKLTLQILSRYRTWMQAALPAYHASSSASLTAPGASANPASGRNSFETSRRPGTPNEEASEDAALQQLATFVSDLQRLEEKGLLLFKQEIEPRLPSSADTQPSFEAVMQVSLASTASVIRSLSSQISNILIKRCAERLRFIRSVGSSARSARTMPSQPSYFVTDIFKDLATFVNGPGRIVTQSTRTQWTTVVADEIATRYAGILLNIQKTEESLRKIKKGRQGGFSFFGRSSATATAGNEATAGPSEEDARVKRQMQLDVEQLATDAVHLGVEVDKSKAFIELKRTLEEEPGRNA